jgi:hypothetical protein
VFVVSSLVLLKIGLLSFWGLWFVMVFSTNLFEGLKVLHRLSWTWKFASHNFQPVVLATAEYHAPAWLPKALFSGVLLWQLTTVLLFGWAIVASIENASLNWALVDAAFAAGLGLWGAFMLADEFFKEYDTEHTHVQLFTAQLVTVVALHVLPS